MCWSSFGFIRFWIFLPPPYQISLLNLIQKFLPLNSSSRFTASSRLFFSCRSFLSLVSTWSNCCHIRYHSWCRRTHTLHFWFYPLKSGIFRSSSFRSASSGVLTKIWNRLLKIGGHREATTPRFGFFVDFCYADAIGLVHPKSSTFPSHLFSL